MAEQTTAIWLHATVLTSLLVEDFPTPSTDPLHPTPVPAGYVYIVKASHSAPMEGIGMPDRNAPGLIIDITEEYASELYLIAVSESANYDMPVILYDVHPYPDHAIMEENGTLAFFKDKVSLVPVSFDPLECRLTHRDFWFYHTRIGGTGTGHYGIDIAMYDDDETPFGYFEFQIHLTRNEDEKQTN